VRHEYGHGGTVPVGEAKNGVLDGFSTFGIHQDFGE